MLGTANLVVQFERAPQDSRVPGRAENTGPLEVTSRLNEKNRKTNPQFSRDYRDGNETRSVTVNAIGAAGVIGRLRSKQPVQR